MFHSAPLLHGRPQEFPFLCVWKASQFLSDSNTQDSYWGKVGLLVKDSGIQIGPQRLLDLLQLAPPFKPRTPFWFIEMKGFLVDTTGTKKREVSMLWHHTTGQRANC